MENNSSAREILNAGRAIGERQIIDGVPVIVAPEGYEVHTLDLENFQEKPKRCKDTVRLETVDSFCSFVDRQTIEGRTIIFADLSARRFTAVIDYHKSGIDPGWGDHSAVLSMTETSSWKRWVGNNNVKMDQLPFADLIEAGADDIIEPSGADVMELISALKVKKKAEFHSVIDTKTGNQTIQFTEKTEGEATKGNLDFFGRFSLGIKPFRGSAVYKVACRLRFIITQENKLKVFYSMINPEMVVEDAFSVETSKIAQHMAGKDIPLFDGTF